MKIGDVITCEHCGGIVELYDCTTVHINKVRFDFHNRWFGDCMNQELLELRRKYPQATGISA